MSHVDAYKFLETLVSAWKTRYADFYLHIYPCISVVLGDAVGTGTKFLCYFSSSGQIRQSIFYLGYIGY